jgi:hypothetical protein
MTPGIRQYRHLAGSFQVSWYVLCYWPGDYQAHIELQAPALRDLCSWSVTDIASCLQFRTLTSYPPFRHYIATEQLVMYHFSCYDPSDHRSKDTEMTLSISVGAVENPPRPFAFDSESCTAHVELKV